MTYKFLLDIDMQKERYDEVACFLRQIQGPQGLRDSKQQCNRVLRETGEVLVESTARRELTYSTRPVP